MFIIGIILGAGVVVFVLQNIAPVSVAFLSWQFDGSLALIVILAILLGMIISWLLAIPDLLRLSDLKSHNNKLQKDLDVHRQKLSETEGKLSQAETPVVVVEQKEF
jgi:lipopolysaccharide assembly protein A